MTNSLTTDCIDQELQLGALATISGGGKQAKAKFGQWLEKPLATAYEGSDYADDFITCWQSCRYDIFKKPSVYEILREKGPRPGVEY